MKQTLIISFISLLVISCNKITNSNTIIETEKDSIFIKDYNQYWSIVNDNFAYFDTRKTDWNKVKEIFQPIVDTITNTNDFITILEMSNNELYNGHIGLNRNTSTSSKLIPTSTDIWAIYKNGKFYIESIRENSKIEKTDLKVGMEIIEFNNIQIKEAIKEFLPKSFSNYNSETYEFSVNTLLAGKHTSNRSIKVLQNNNVLKVELPYSNNEDYYSNNKLLSSKLLENNIGCIKINNSLGNNDLIEYFDKELDDLFDTKSLILDLRETPSGGNNTIAKAIMGRFISTEKSYQRYRFTSDEKETGVKQIWTEQVFPRGKTYSNPLVILVGRWTGSMGEGIAIGFDGMKRAEIVGSEMAKLLGGTWNYKLDKTGIGFQIPYNKIYHINKTPRENFVPEFKTIQNVDYLKKTKELLNKTNANNT